MTNPTKTLLAAEAHPAKRGGTRNAERSAATRDKILNATVQCLHERGYHNTSTVLVTQVAGVSRGAMLHHFPSKADLMIATMDHIGRHMGAKHREGLSHITDERERFAALVDVLWGEFSQPIGVARIEIMMASRSDPDSGPAIARFNAELDRRHKEAVWPRAQGLGFTDRARVDAIVQLYAAAIRGLAIDALSPDVRARTGAAVALLRETMLAWVDAAR